MGYAPAGSDFVLTQAGFLALLAGGGSEGKRLRIRRNPVKNPVHDDGVALHLGSVAHRIDPTRMTKPFLLRHVDWK